MEDRKIEDRKIGDRKIGDRKMEGRRVTGNPFSCPPFFCLPSDLAQNARCARPGAAYVEEPPWRRARWAVGQVSAILYA
jgi:hypothetical protein